MSVLKVGPIAGIALLLAAGCRSSSPATLSLASGDVLRGSATTSVNGQYYVTNERLNCYGSYEGRQVAGIGLTAGRKAVVTVRCSNGKTGASGDRIYESGEAQLRFTDGTTARLTIEDR